MANFFLIDQSFHAEGSHHGDYLQCVAAAAKEQGFRVFIGANRKLPLNKLARSPLNALAPIRPHFYNTTYQRFSDLAGLQRMKRRNAAHHPPASTSFLRTLIRNLQGYYACHRRDSIIRQFSRDCATFFRGIELNPDDHIFFPSLSDLELIGLASFLARTPGTKRSQWHAQFHFNLFHGRPPAYEQQTQTLQAVQVALSAALTPVIYHHLNLYTSTEELADQFNLLGVGYFQPLSYPIAQAFAPDKNRIAQIHSRSEPHPRSVEITTSVPASRANEFSNSLRQATSSILFSSPNRPVSQDSLDANSTRENQDEEAIALSHPRALPVPLDSPARLFSSSHRPLRVVCPGAVRREKGQQAYFQPLVNQIYDSLLATQKVQLVAQLGEKKIGAREKLSITFPENMEPPATFDPVAIVPHPLPREEYARLIQETDIGLLFYDSEVYFSRRAGILGELLAAGKPVVVPAGCWLAEQLSKPIFQHCDRYFENQEHRRLKLSELKWDRSNVPLHGGIINFDDQRRPFHFEVELAENESTIGIRFEWHWPLEKGIYCCLEVEQFDRSDTSLQKTCQVVGHRLSSSRLSANRKPMAMFAVAPNTSRVRVTLKNAFHHSSASVRNLEFLVATPNPLKLNKTIPLGAVGVIAPSLDQLGESLREIVTHYEHYRQTAEQFSYGWYAHHNPRQTVRQLVSHDALAADVA